MLRWWHTALFLFSTRWSNGRCTDLRLPGGHLCMDERTSPPAQPGKDWASCLPCHPNSTAWFHHPARFFYNYPINFDQKSWCNLWWPADLQRAHCKDYSILQVCITQRQKIRPFLTEHAAQHLVQALVISRLDYYNALLAGLPSSSIKPLQIVQNAAARLVFNEPKRTHVTSLFISLHWLPRHWCLHIEQPQAQLLPPADFHSLLRIYIPSRSLRSTSERCLVVPLQRGSKSLCRTFSFTVPVWWSSHPYLECWIPDHFQATAENSSLSTLPDFILNLKKTKQKKPCLSLYLLLPFLACTYLNNAWDMVWRALPVSVCLSKMNRFMYSPIVSRFG